MILRECPTCLGCKRVFNGTDYDICIQCLGDGTIYQEEESDYLDEESEYTEDSDIKYPSEWEQFDELKHSSEEDSL